MGAVSWDCLSSGEAAGWVEDFKGGERADIDLLCCLDQSLESLSICLVALGELHRDVIVQDVLDGGVVEGHQQLLIDVIFIGHTCLYVSNFASQLKLPTEMKRSNFELSWFRLVVHTILNWIIWWECQQTPPHSHFLWNWPCKYHTHVDFCIWFTYTWNCKNTSVHHSVWYKLLYTSVTTFNCKNKYQQNIVNIIYTRKIPIIKTLK